MHAYPRISVVIPSFNQARFLGRAIASVLRSEVQPEVIIVDGGSSDNSVAVINGFGGRIDWWVSEPDEGQADAINKGLRHATGDVWVYLNSDDLLEPNGLTVVSQFFRDNPQAEWLSGGCRVFGEDIEDWFLHAAGVSSRREVLTPWDRNDKYVFPQSGACFMRRSVIEKIGYFDPTYHYSMDIEYYTRAAVKANIHQHVTEDVLAAWRWHPDAKSFQKGIAYAFREDEVRIAEQYLDCLEPADQVIVQRQLGGQRRDLLIRKAMWHVQQSERWNAARCLAQSAVRYPSSFGQRPWWGACRRVPLGARG